jgi:hypothetical protein
MPRYSAKHKALIANAIGETCFNASTITGGGSEESTPEGLIIPTVINTTIIGTPAVIATSPEGLFWKDANE